MHELLQRLKAYALQSKLVRIGESNAAFAAAQGNQHAEQAREALHNLRTVTLRNESRSANLAYGFLLGRDYWQMEHSCHEYPDLQDVENLVMQYGSGSGKRAWNSWLLRAMQYLEAQPPMSTVHEELEPEIKHFGQQVGGARVEVIEVNIPANSDLGAMLTALMNGGVHA